MNKAIKKRWVEALRSGHYEQGKGHLKLGDKHCCLGVLCEIAVTDRVVTPWKADPLWDEFRFVAQSVGPCDSTLTLPIAVMEWAGLQLQSPTVYVDGGVDELTKLNDDGLTFDAIAAVIEEHL
jgi:hypothetical protein